MSLLNKLFRHPPASSVLGRQIGETLPEGMIVPEPFEKLFQWIEANGFFEDTPRGRVGYLCPVSYLRDHRTDDGRPGGTEISFAAAAFPELGYWFHNPSQEVKDAFRVFAQTGGDGSVAALWTDQASGIQKIVHVGSGSGSVLQCVLADDPIDFLRLLAIGYDEICFADFAAPPPPDGEFVVTPYLPFREWVTDTFRIEIPATGSEIVRHPSSMDDSNSDDPFWNWVRRVSWAKET